MDSWSLEDSRTFQLDDITDSMIARYRVSKRIFQFLSIYVEMRRRSSKSSNSFQDITHLSTIRTRYI